MSLSLPSLPAISLPLPLPELNLTKHQKQLLATALSASVGTAALLSGVHLLRERRRHRERRDRRRELEGDALRSALGSAATSTLHTRQATPTGTSHERGGSHITLGGPAYDEDLIREQLARNYAFFWGGGHGADTQGARCGGGLWWGGELGECYAGAVVSPSARFLGISHIRLVDFDYVTLSSLNRHATAVLADVGTPKVACVARTLRDISKWVEVDTRVDVWKNDENGAKLLEGADWVVDAIDNIQTKVDLLHYCATHQIRVFSSMGAGAKSDPTRIQIADISQTIYDPLARSVRRRLRLLGVPSGIPVVYSTEVPSDDVKLLPLPEEEFAKGRVEELGPGVLELERVRILPVLGPLPAIFGLNAATYVLCELAGRGIENPMAVKMRRRVYERMLKDLQAREGRRAVGRGEREKGVTERLPIDEDDVALVFEDVYRGRSGVPPFVVPTKPTLVRWNPHEPITPENLVVMEAKEAARHERAVFGDSISSESEAGDDEAIVEGAQANGTSGKKVITGEELWGAEVAQLVRKRAAEVRRVREWVDCVGWGGVGYVEEENIE
ncbi:ThiF domain-containing protein [Mycena chlorophos]|uniref:ThiF domain-containing protein n=1 Tax=Mycena chlorophos TaxID=658473 RepID=A0A8H6SCL8_MYCCL|nr:ThiF domain-containing protein [Mycena chlorophos]